MPRDLHADKMREVLGTEDPDDIDGRNDVTEAIHGLEGNDTISGDKDDVLYGDDGDDRLSGAARIRGGEGDDQIFGAGANEILRGEGGDDYIIGGMKGGWLSGDLGDDTIYGGNAIDTLKGGLGDDFLRGGGESDLIRGGSGNDGLWGETGSDTLIGGAGDDVLYAGLGAHNVVQGGSGSDQFDIFKYSSGSLTITDVSVEDRLLFGEFGNNTKFRQDYIGEDTVVTLHNNNHGDPIEIVITFQGVHLTGKADPTINDTDYVVIEGTDLFG